tara:strand:- start:139 stop:1239 length:1101 start_codon:yes stop_codon:yes gene_type:complete
MKRKTKTRYGLVMFASAMTCLNAGAALAETTLSFADYGPNRGTRAETVQWFLSEIESRTEGRVKVNQHWGGALLGTRNGFDGVQAGVADIVTISAVYSSHQELFGYRVGDLPITSKNEISQTMAMYDLATTNESIQAQFDNAGVVYLANYAVGPIQMVCNGADIATFDDLVGKTVSYQTAEYGMIFDDLGVNTTSISTPESYQALNTGLVDCAQTYPYTTLSYKMIEVSDQFLVFNLGTIGSNGIFMNGRTFDRLKPRDQEIVRDLGREMTERNARAIRKENLEVLARFPDGIDGNKLDVVEISDADRAMIEEASQPYIQAWIDQASNYGLDGKGIVEEYEALIESRADEITAVDTTTKREEREND